MLNLVVTLFKKKKLYNIYYIPTVKTIHSESAFALYAYFDA